MLFFLVFAAVPYAVSAYSMSGVDSLLSNYSVPSGVVSGLSAVNFTYNGITYVGLYNGSHALSFLVNTSGKYFFVLNSTLAYQIIRNYTQNQAFSQASFTGISSLMHSYLNTSAGSLGDCLQETGLGSGDTCTVGNYCASCQGIPSCKQVLDATGGVTGIFGTGVMSFSTAYATLSADEGTFFNTINTISRNNVLFDLAQLNSSFAGIENVTKNIYKNPIFPPTADITADVLSTCSNYYTLNSAPWFCASLGYCFNLNYNYTKLAIMNASMAKLSSLPLSNNQVMEVAQGAVDSEMVYAYPVLSKSKMAALNALVNSTLPGYGALVNDSAFLLTHITDAKLSSALAKISASYNGVVSNYFTANLTTAKVTLSAEYKNLSSEFTALNASYSSIVTLSKANTAKLLELQVPRQGVSGDLLGLAFSELSLNGVLSSGKVTNVTGISMQLSAISSKLSGYSTDSLSPVELARYFDTPFVTAMASAMGLSYSSAVSMAPILGMLLPLLVGIIALILLMVVRVYLKSGHKLMENRRTASHWSGIYKIVIIITVLWMAATYLLLASASSSAPFGAFKGAYSSSKYLVVAINGTPTASALSCASRIGTQATAAGKTPVQVRFANGQCTTNNSTRTADSCLGFYAGTNIPVVILEENTLNTISLYSLYGTVLKASGNDTTMGQCYISLLTG